MNFAFSTSAFPNLPIEEIFKKAKKYGFNAIEPCGLTGETYVRNFAEQSKENKEKIIGLADEQAVRINVLNTGIVLSDGDNMSGKLLEPYEYVDLAESIGARYIKVKGERRTEPSVNDEVNIYYILENLKQICTYAKPKNISVLVETNGVFSDSRLLARVMDSLNCKNSGVSWNVSNTVRYASENPHQTAAVLGKTVKHVQITDSVCIDGTVCPRLMGKGDLPIDEAILALKKIGFREDVSFVWPVDKFPDIADADIALPQFLYYVKNLSE